MIDALIQGRLHGKPEARTSGNGRGYVRCRLRVPQGGQDSLFVSAVAFSDTLKEQLLTLDGGESVAMSGPLELSVYVPQDAGKPAGLNASLVVHALLTPYHVTRRRDAMRVDKPKPPPASHGDTARASPPQYAPLPE